MAIVRADARAIPLADGVVQCVVTSPPYFGLRDYQVEKQIGLEPTPMDYVATLVRVFREVKRVLREDGTVWVNLGSSYWHDSPSGPQGKKGQRANRTFTAEGAGGASLHARPYGTSGKGQPDSHPNDSTSFRLCDGCRAVLAPDGNSRSGHLPVIMREPSFFASNRGHREFASGHFPTSDYAYQASRTTDANLDLPTSQDLAGAPLPASQVSTLLRSFEQPPAACSHCDNCGVCLNVIASSSRDSRLCARRADYRIGKDERGELWRSHMTDMVLSSTAWRYLTTTSLKAKDDAAIPWLLALALRMDGWYLRSDIIWAKPNPMPESVTDRPTRSHEHIFLLAKSERYFYDAEAIRERAVEGTDLGLLRGRKAGADNIVAWHAPSILKRQLNGVDSRQAGTSYRNKRDVWTVPSEPVFDAHFATYPQKLIEPCILAGSRPGDLVLDPFLGSGTTGAVCERLGRRWIGAELSAQYIAIARRRTAQTGLRFQGEERHGAEPFRDA